jgi:hypothetical protein
MRKERKIIYCTEIGGLLHLSSVKRDRKQRLDFSDFFPERAVTAPGEERNENGITEREILKAANSAIQAQVCRSGTEV